MEWFWWVGRPGGENNAGLRERDESQLIISQYNKKSRCARQVFCFVCLGVMKREPTRYKSAQVHQSTLRVSLPVSVLCGGKTHTMGLLSSTYT